MNSKKFNKLAKYKESMKAKMRKLQLEMTEKNDDAGRYIKNFQ